MKRLLSLLAAGWMLLPGSVYGQYDGHAVEQLQKFAQAYRYLSAVYVDSLDTAPLAEEAIRAMLERLDPHSAYLSAEEMRGVDESFDGRFSGIGIEFNILNDTVMVVNTIAGGPSAAVGLLPGDRIVGIDGENAVGLSRAEVPERLRGPAGTQVRLQVRRHGEPSLQSFAVTRGEIPLHTIDAAYRVDDKIGYIKVNRFGRTTMSEFNEAFDRMDDVESLILDLRGNGGGLLGQAVGMANFFLPRGCRIVSTEGRAVPPQSYDALADGRFLKGNVVVLIDENSASASEIVAGALQDWDRAVIVGRPSFGKGLVQRQFRLDDGSAIRVTVARYHTPSGRVIQRPYEKGRGDEYYAAHRERLLHETGISADTIPEGTPLYETLRRGRKVYGGGGIRPDVRVAADTVGVTDYWAALMRQGVVNELVLRCLDRHRAELESRYPAFGPFGAEFEVTPEIWNELAEMAAECGIVPRDGEAEASAPLLAMQIKASIAERLFPREGFYRVMNEAPHSMFRRAVELLQAWPEEGAPLLGAGA